MDCQQPQRLRDAHGFLVGAEYEQLARIYAPVHEREEEQRCRAWAAFLATAAAQLGMEGDSSASSAPHADDAAGARSPAALASAVLPRLLEDPEASPGLAASLAKLVHAGVPRHLRAAAWPLLLRAGRGVPRGRYQALLHIVEAGEQLKAVHLFIMRHSITAHSSDVPGWGLTCTCTVLHCAPHYKTAQLSTLEMRAADAGCGEPVIDTAGRWRAADRT